MLITHIVFLCILVPNFRNQELTKSQSYSSIVLCQVFTLKNVFPIWFIYILIIRSHVRHDLEHYNTVAQHNNARRVIQFTDTHLYYYYYYHRPAALRLPIRRFTCVDKTQFLFHSFKVYMPVKEHKESCSNFRGSYTRPDHYVKISIFFFAGNFFLLFSLLLHVHFSIRYQRHLCFSHCIEYSTGTADVEEKTHKRAMTLYLPTRYIRTNNSHRGFLLVHYNIFSTTGCVKRIASVSPITPPFHPIPTRVEVQYIIIHHRRFL